VILWRSVVGALAYITSVKAHIFLSTNRPNFNHIIYTTGPSLQWLRHLFAGAVRLPGPWRNVQTARRRCWTQWRKARLPSSWRVSTDHVETDECQTLCWHVAGTGRRGTEQCEQTTATPCICSQGHQFKFIFFLGGKGRRRSQMLSGDKLT